MKKLPSIALSFLFAAAAPAYGALMLDFGATVAADPYLTLSPGHSSGWVAGGETSWNTITSSASRNDLVFSDGAAATGVTLTLGQESAAGSNSLNYATAISSLNLAGSGGGTPNQQSLLTPGSIYGDDSASTAAGRDGFFGGAGSAVGLRVDGLAAGPYAVYVMARNTNSNVATSPMNIFTATGAAASTFDFAPLPGLGVTNPGYPSDGYTDGYSSFVAGENFVRAEVMLEAGESLFLAIDGSGTETRGFMNMVQIVPVPEPSAALLGALGLLVLGRRRR